MLGLLQIYAVARRRMQSAIALEFRQTHATVARMAKRKPSRIEPPREALRRKAYDPTLQFTSEQKDAVLIHFIQETLAERGVELTGEQMALFLQMTETVVRSDADEALDELVQRMRSRKSY